LNPPLRKPAPGFKPVIADLIRNLQRYKKECGTETAMTQLLRFFAFGKPTAQNDIESIILNYDFL